LPDASFAAQSEPLAEIRTLQAYTEWMKGLLTFMPDGRYVVKSFATDDERSSVCAYGVFSATHTGDGGPCPRPARAPTPITTTLWSLLATRSPHDEDLERGLGDARARLGVIPKITKPGPIYRIRAVASQTLAAIAKTVWCRRPP
jgi:hypothetical protein